MSEEKVTFEEAYAKLKAAGEKLESGEVTLEEAMASYEEGVKYYKMCSEILEAAKQKIEEFDKERES